MLATLELEHARQPLALEADEAVRIVLENRQRPIAGKLREAPAPLVRERRPGRILEGRNRIEQRRRADAGQLVDVEPVRVDRDLDELATLGEQDLPRPVVSRPLDDHRPGGQRREQKVEDLQRAVRDDDAPRLNRVPFRDPLPQRLVPESAPVGEDRRPVPPQRRLRAVGKLLDRQAFRRRNPACERDRHEPEFTAAARCP